MGGSWSDPSTHAPGSDPVTVTQPPQDNSPLSQAEYDMLPIKTGWVGTPHEYGGWESHIDPATGQNVLVPVPPGRYYTYTFIDKPKLGHDVAWVVDESVDGVPVRAHWYDYIGSTGGGFSGEYDHNPASDPTDTRSEWDYMHNPSSPPPWGGPWEWVGSYAQGVWQPKEPTNTTPWVPPELVGPRHPVSHKRDVTDYDPYVDAMRRRLMWPVKTYFLRPRKRVRYF